MVLWLCIVFHAAFAWAATSVSDVNLVAAWVTKTGDNKKYPFVILDKKNAHIYVFTSEGVPVGDAPALLGMSVGDILPAGIAGKPLSKIPPKDRITQAGRFFARKGYDNHDKVVLWVDFATQLAIHEVINVPRQRRPQRLATPTTKDNRISWGCINVPIAFFHSTLMGTLSSGKGYVYILPEVLPVADFFGFNRSKVIEYMQKE